MHTAPFYRRYRLFLLLTFLVFAVFTLAGMQKHLVWGDEAETALFAKNILQFGIPMGWNGKNILGLYNGIVLNPALINNTTPWGQYYVAALSFALFGFSTVSARLPFVLFSFLSFFLTYQIVCTISTQKRFHLLTLTLLSISVPYILFAYQARYYALAACATLGLIYGFLLIKTRPKMAGICIAVFGIFFFHAHYASFAAFYAAICLAYVLVYGIHRRMLVLLGIASLVIALTTLPWLLVLRPGTSQQESLLINFNLRNGTELFLRHAQDLNANGAIPVVLMFVFTAVILGGSQRIRDKDLVFIAITCLGFIILFSLISPQRIDISSHSYIRYVMNIYVLGVILQASAIHAVMQKHKFAGLMLLLATTTTLVSLQLPPRIFMWEYVQEMANVKYTTSTREVLAFFKDKNIAGNTAFVSPDYAIEPLQFYLDDQLRFINRISPNNAYLLAANKDKLPEYVYSATQPPDWIILFGKSQMQFNARKIPETVNLAEYTEHILPVFAYDLTRPEIFDHRFSPVEEFGDDLQVFIYERTHSKSSN